MLTDLSCTCGGEIIERDGVYICLACGFERDEDEFQDLDESD